MLSWSQKRTRCAWSSRWRWTVKTATSSSFVARSPPSAFTLWTPPASAVATSWTWVKDTQVDEGYLLPHLLSYMLAPSHIFKCSQWANTHLHVLPVFLFLQSLFLSSCCFLCLYFEPLCLPGRLFLTFFLFMLLPLPPLLIWPLSLFGVWRSAHHSLPHVRINVLHLPAHTQIRLHRHQTQPSLGSLSLWLWLWGWGRMWRAAGAGPAPPGPHLRSARWGWTCRWPCMEVQNQGWGWKYCYFQSFTEIMGRKKKASTLVQPCKCQLIPLLCWLCPCCALIPCNIHWTQEYSQLDPSLLSSDRFHCRGCGETFFLQEWSVCLCVCVLSFTKSLTLIAHFHLPYDAL